MISFAAPGILLTVLAVVLWLHLKETRLRKALEIKLKERTEDLFNKNRLLDKDEQQILFLQQKSADLERREQLKSRWFADISHEFRTPLTLVQGSLSRLVRFTDSPDVKRITAVMSRNSRRMQVMVEQLLDLTQLENSCMTLNATEMDVIPMLAEMVESFSLGLGQQRLEFHAADSTILVFADADKLEKIIANLLSNSVKFTPADGVITVSAAQVTKEIDQEFLEIAVKDTGPGIPHHQLPYIFDRFFQVPETNDQHTAGSGIGLALAKELVKLHGGMLDVHSTEGKGTEFVVRLPLGRLQKNQLKREPAPLPRQYQWNLPTGIEKSAAPARPEHSQAGDSADQKKILVVEDSAEMRTYYRESLQAQYNVIEASDGREGLRIAEAETPDVVISDIMMPNTDGYQFCRELKNNPRTSHIPIILLSALAEEKDLLRGLECRADRFLTKPFNMDVLLLHIQNLFLMESNLVEFKRRQALMKPEDVPATSMDTVFINEIHHLLEANLADPEFNVDRLAAKLYMSRSGLYRKLFAISGISPVELIRSYRLMRAAQLLTKHSGNITETAMQVGFPNVAYFTKCFKKHFGQLPSAFTNS